MMMYRTEHLEAMLAGSTPGPWMVGPDQEGEPAFCVSADGFDICTAWGGYNAAIPDLELIAAVPTLAADLIAARVLLAEVFADHGKVNSLAWTDAVAKILAIGAKP